MEPKSHWKQFQIHNVFLLAVATNGAPVLLLLFNAGALDISWAKGSSSVLGIMEAYFPAQAAGDALYQIITMQDGSVPAGRLTTTWPASLDQVSTFGARFLSIFSVFVCVFVFRCQLLFYNDIRRHLRESGEGNRVISFVLNRFLK